MTMIQYGDNRQEILFVQGDHIKTVSGSYYFPDKGPFYAIALKDHYQGSTTKVPIEFDLPQLIKTIVRGMLIQMKRSLSLN